MNKRIRYILSILICVFLIQLNCSKYSVQAQNNVDRNMENGANSQIQLVNHKFSVNIDKLNRTNIDLDKEWNIKFSEPVDRSTIYESIKVVSKDDNKELNPFICLKENDTVISVTSHYEVGGKYSLIVDKKLKSKNNTNLKNSFTLNFEMTNIKSIDNLNMTTFVSDKINFPKYVQATLSNGRTSEVKVSWDSKPSNLSEGDYELNGSVKNWNGKVKLKLHVVKKPVQKPDIRPSRGDYNYNKNNDYINNRDNTNVDKSLYHSKLQKDLFDYLSNEDNRKSVMKRAVELHGGVLANNCVYFASEALRRAGMENLPDNTCNTLQLTDKLTHKGWIKSTDLSQLKPGDICFTIAYNEYGPTHTYVFMKWVDADKYDYAYICDNQGREYDGIYHKRNVNIQTTKKDKISYFMYPKQ